MTQQLDQRYVFGDLLRDWRRSRNVTQMALANKAEISPRHLSFVENGRSTPSRSLVIRLAGHLEVPLRGRNQLLLAAGFAPEYSKQELDGPRLSMVRMAIRKVLTGHDPYPALVVDHSWNLVEANASASLLIAELPADLLAEPCNMLRISLHPRGLAPRILNLEEWSEHVLDRLGRQMRISGDRELVKLHAELTGYIGNRAPRQDAPSRNPVAGDVIVPMRLQHGEHVLSLFSTVTTFGTPRDITVEELAIEAFYPADEETSELLRTL